LILENIDLTKEFNESIKPEINRRLRNALIAFLIFGITGFLIDHFNAPSWLALLAIILLALFYLHQINRFMKIGCPNCGYPIAKSIKFGTPKTCDNCSAIFRDT